MDLPLLLKAFYAVMAIAVLSMMGLYACGLSSPRRITPKVRVPFYGWIGFLIAAGIGLHVLTTLKVPWVHWELRRARIKPDREVVINVGEHRFRVPPDGIRLREGEVVRFRMLSADLTYGFGVFREDGRMEFQMQVNPGHQNDIIWIFSRPGRYSIRSTEYAGPETWKMRLKDAIVVEPAPRLAGGQPSS